MVFTRFTWPHGGRQVFLCGSFSSWMEHYPMTALEGLPSVFHTIRDLPPGVHQYRFLVDGMWRCDELQLCVADDHGTVNNVIIIGLAVPDVANPVQQIDPYVSDGILYTAPPPSFIAPETLPQISTTEIEASRYWVSELLSNQTIYDILPLSSKVFVMDAQLPVKQAFHIMYDEGLAVVPIWDDSRATVTGILTASDFILILRQLQNNVQVLADEELEMHSVAAWKQGKSQLYVKSNGPVGLSFRPLIHGSDQESLRDIALKILQNEISAVPVFRSSSQDASFMPLLSLASLPEVLKYICCHFGEVVGSMPFLQHPICRIPLGTWSPEIGKVSGHQLAMLHHNAPLSSALHLLLEARISSIPIVDDNGALLDVYSRSDIIALAKADMYAHIQLGQVTMSQALDLVYQAYPQHNGRRRCHTCFQSTPFHEVIEQLSFPGVRRLVVIDPRNKRVEGVISLRDVASFFLG